MKRFRKFIAISIVSMIGVCLVLSILSAIGNRTLPEHSPVVET